MAEEIELSEEQETALDRAWEKLGELPPPSSMLSDRDEPGREPREA